MNLFSSLLGRSSFKFSNQVIESVCDFERYNNLKEPLYDADSLLVFKSQTQQCWLVFTDERMYFVLDDTELGNTQALWARDKENLVEDNRVTLNLKTEDVSKETGRVLIGTMNKGFLYTKSLFPDTTITGKILHLCNKHFLEKARTPE